MGILCESPWFPCLEAAKTAIHGLVGGWWWPWWCWVWCLLASWWDLSMLDKRWGTQRFGLHRSPSCPLAPLLTVFTSPHNLWTQITDCPHQTDKRGQCCKGTKKKHLETCSSDRMEDQAGRRGQGPELVLIKISISRIIRPLRCCALDLPAAWGRRWEIKTKQIEII